MYRGIIWNLDVCAAGRFKILSSQFSHALVPPPPRLRCRRYASAERFTHSLSRPLEIVERCGRTRDKAARTPPILDNVWRIVALEHQPADAIVSVGAHIGSGAQIAAQHATAADNELLDRVRS
mmetsp:Transcript_37184/g.74327  ORF Transcript_37184/g.74327 Transcript_37184/m.74327 type:complete len:123 (-) Transcript_37184:76-444(-)